MDLNKIREAVGTGRIEWQRHALERMLKRGISRDYVKNAVLYGEVIEEYPSDYPFPSCLMLYMQETPLHVVLAYHEANQILYVITTYIPDSEHFENDFKTRRNRE